MAAFANLILKDGKATPVDHTFQPKTSTGRTAMWEDRATGIPIAYPKASCATKDSPVVRRVKLGITLPILKQINGVNDQGYTPAASVSHQYGFSGEFILPQIGTEAERNDFVAYVSNYIANAVVQQVLRKGDEIVG